MSVDLDRTWRDRLAEMTRLATEYHALDERGDANSRSGRRLLRRLVTARQRFVQVDEVWRRAQNSLSASASRTGNAAVSAFSS